MTDVVTYDVFIAHRRAQKGLARDVKYHLERRAKENAQHFPEGKKLRVFLDDESIVAGEKARRLLEVAAAADRMVFICPEPAPKPYESFVSLELLSFLTGRQVSTVEELAHVALSEAEAVRASERSERITLLDAADALHWKGGKLDASRNSLPLVVAAGCLRRAFDAEPTRISPLPGDDPGLNSLAARAAVSVLAGVLKLEPGAIASRALEEERREARRSRLRQWFAVAVALITASLALVAYTNYRQAERDRSAAQASSNREKEERTRAEGEQARAQAFAAKSLASLPRQQGEALVLALKTAATWPANVTDGLLVDALAATTGGIRASHLVRSGHDDLGTANPVVAARFTADRTLILSISNAGRVCAHRATDLTLVRCDHPFIVGTALGTAPLTTSYCRAGELRDGRWVVELWDQFEGKMVKEFVRKDRVTSCVFSADGTKLVVSDHGGAAVVYDLSKKAADPVELRARRDAECFWHGSAERRETADDRRKPCPLGNALITPDGATVFAAGWDGRVHWWDVASRASHNPLVHGDGNHLVRGLAINESGTLLASGAGDGTVRLWDPRNGELQGTIDGHGAEVGSIALRGDESVLTSSWDQRSRLWSRRSNGEWTVLEELIGHDYFVFDGTFEPRGQRLLTSSTDGFRVWNDPRGNAADVHTFETDRTGLVLSAVDPTAAAVVATDGQALLATHTSRVVRSIDTGFKEPTTGVVDPSGELLVLGARDGRLASVSLSGKAPTRNETTLGVGVQAISVSRDRHTIAVIDLLGRVHVTDRELRTVTPIGHHGAGVRGIALSDDGRWIATYFGHHARGGERPKAIRGVVFWDTHTKTNWRPDSIVEEVWDVEFASDQPGTAFMAANDAWHVRPADRTASRLSTGHGNAITDLDYDSRTRHLAIGACDWTVRVLNFTGPAESAALKYGMTTYPERHRFCVDSVVVTGSPLGMVFSAAETHDTFMRLQGVAGDRVLTGLPRGDRAIVVSQDVVMIGTTRGFNVYPLRSPELAMLGCQLLRSLSEGSYPDAQAVCGHRWGASKGREDSLPNSGDSSGLSGPTSN